VLKVLERLILDRSGASSIEYCLLAALIFMVIILAVSQVGSNLIPWFQAVADGLN
jgi:Flp pilus assembly pilin Flp